MNIGSDIIDIDERTAVRDEAHACRACGTPLSHLDNRSYCDDECEHAYRIEAKL